MHKRRVMKFCPEDFFEVIPVDDVFAGSGVIQLEEAGNCHRLSFGCPSMAVASAEPVHVVSKVLLSTADLASVARAIMEYLAALRASHDTTALRTAHVEGQALN
jgi:hypothetical protein